MKKHEKELMADAPKEICYKCGMEIPWNEESSFGPEGSLCVKCEGNTDSKINAELLQALEEMVRTFDEHDCWALDSARAAIAKANGEPSASVEPETL